MFRILAILLIVVPALEIWALLSVGKLIGGLSTFLLLLLSGFLGAYLSKREARRVLDYARAELSRGQIPTGAILDGICIFAGGLLLMTPGFLTDILGFLLLFPLTRPLFKKGIVILIRKYISNGNIQFFYRK